MSENATWMPLYVGDYLADTQRLTTEQHGAYLLLIFDYWRNGSPPDDDAVLAQIVKMERAKWRKTRPVIERLFQVVAGEWKHKRIEAERGKAGDITDKRRAAANARWEREKGKTGDANADANASVLDVQMALPSQPQSQPQLEEGSQLEKIPLPHGALAFSGRVIRLNRRDFDQWAKAYHGIPDLAAELTALDDWLRESDDPKLPKRWFQVVSGALAKKHQAAVRANDASRDPMENFIV